MSRRSHYVINVARNEADKLPPNGVPVRWTHFFRVECEGSKQSTYEIATALKTRFPDCNVEMTFWDVSGTSIDSDKWVQS